ncbi:HNH endonuclease [Bacillus phage 1_ICo-2020]|uniref:HNH endonuclease n=1 Tax=Bacillus phage 1_ICo-2020 TaxID=2759272 RepID=A0A7G8AKI3_9CAUD|nr:HNH endonuclease [Bacillus phage 1_ICo-2020]
MSWELYVKNTNNRKGKGSGVYLSRKYNLTHPTKKYYSRPIPAHRLIAYIKYGEVAFEAECVRHLNDNSLDNSWDNIALGTHMDNHLDAVRNGKTEPKKAKAPRVETFGERLSRNIDVAISLRNEGKTYLDIGKLFGVSDRTVSKQLKKAS